MVLGKNISIKIDSHIANYHSSVFISLKTQNITGVDFNLQIEYGVV